MERRPPNLPNPTTTRQNTPMRHLTVSILVTLAVLLGSAGESFALPECPGSPTNSVTVWTSWNNCEGTVISTIFGSKYVGEWKDGKRHGQGTYTLADGEKYVGEWKDGLPNGQGTVTYADGDKYVGEWKDGKRHGQGTDTYAGGGKYVGEYKDGKWHGQGTYTFADGRVEEGIWENHEFKYAQKITPTVTAKKTPPPSKGEGFALPECPGSPTSSTRRSFWWNNCEGTYTYANGDKYVGEWKDNKYHGQGTYTYADGRKYVGEWKDNKRHGQGTYTTNDGVKYVGEWKNDLPNGLGVRTYADGRVEEGIWENGKFLYAKKP